MNGFEADNPILKHLKSVLDVLSDGIYISDHLGKTLWVNRTYEQLAGLNRDELLGRNVSDLVREGIFNVILNPDVVATGQSKSSVQENKVGRKLILNGYPIFDDSGKVVLVATFARDITLMVQLRDQITEQSELIEKYQKNFQYMNNAKTQAFPVVSSNAVMQRLVQLMERIAPTDVTALIMGETGVGKSIFARKIHELSARHDKPFFKIDCTSIPENLIESELFGYAPGAFTGANPKGKIGFFEMVDKGTIFLDEIGDLPLSMQGKLLRVLQDQEILRVGGTKVRKVDVRVIAATNRDLEVEVRQGKFRSDLYYRLCVAVMLIPPLRERPADILPLTWHFLALFSHKHRKRLVLAREVESAFASYHWPGNVRELENVIHGLVITVDRDEIRLSDLPASMASLPGVKAGRDVMDRLIANEEGRSLKEIVSAMEREIIHASVEYHGSVAAMAKRFKVDRTTVFRKLNRQS
jgi:PAS domain S-box-containing protein